jgi:phenylacetate-CoA ligase
MTTPSSNFAAGDNAQVLRAFAQAARTVPAYRKLLAEAGLDVSAVGSLQDFQQRVPVVDKAALFGRFAPAELCRGGSLEGVTAAYTSSGFSGTFSWGLETAADEQHLRQRLGVLFAQHFGADRIRTLLINALPAGVQVPCPLTLNVTTGPRADAVLAALRSLAGACGQTVILAEQPFLKHLVETGCDSGLDWSRLVVFLVTGGEVMPENFRSYVGGLLGHDIAQPRRGAIIVSAGISEIGLSMGQETALCRMARTVAHLRPEFRQFLLPEAPFVPTLVQCEPASYFLETVPDSSGRSTLVVTTLDPHRRIPLIRYSTGDWARVLDPQAVAGALRQAGVGDIQPELPWPVLALWGRGRWVDVGGVRVFPEQIKEAIYGTPELARRTTANFLIAAGVTGLVLRVQLRQGYVPDAASAAGLSSALESSLRAPVEVVMAAYDDPDFAPQAGFARKPTYIR